MYSFGEVGQTNIKSLYDEIMEVEPALFTIKHTESKDSEDDGNSSSGGSVFDKTKFGIY